jgi:hypothetical protein
MLLCEEHLSGGTFGRTPTLHTALQRAQLSILEAARILPLQKLEHCLGLKPGVPLQQFKYLSPDRNERVWPCPPTRRRRYLTRHPAQAAVLPHRLRVHPCLGRRYLLISLRMNQRE